MNPPANLFDLSPFMPHGACYLWRQDLLLLHVGSDFLIGLAYFSIPAALIVFLKRRPDIPFSGIFKLFVAFILACGVTHLFSIVVVWHPAYGVEGLLKLLTAAVSITTAIALWPLIPKAAALPSPSMLQARNDQIEALNQQLNTRIDSMGTLAGGVAHDFNNLLTVIKGNAELLESSPDSESDNESVAAIINASERATELCRQMLAYSGKGHFMLGEVDLNEQVRNVNIPGKPSVDINYSLSERINYISASTEQIEQLVSDLMCNAVEAIEESDQSTGVVTVSTYSRTLDADDLNKAAFENYAEPGDFVMLEICDSGIGMHPETVKQVFDPFYSTKFTGRGLGLSAVQGIVRGHEACLFVDSEPRQGTTISIAFPIIKTEPLSWRKPGTDVPERPLVLVVDDETGVLELAENYLKRLEFDVITTSEPSQVARLVEQHSDRLHTVILDYLMPRTTGREVLQKIRRISDVDVYLTSGFSRGEINDSYLREQVSGFIPKPFGFNDLQKIFAARSLDRED